MSLQIASINSGSNGNCYYVGNDTDAVLIDVGISCREVEKRMKKIGLDIKKVKAIFVSHEHGDHIKGLGTLAHRYYLPIYITDGTAKNIQLIRHLSKPFIEHQPITIGGLTITGFLKKHDAADPHSFIVNYNNITVGVFTDMGTVCENLIHYFKQCDAVFLESNYDDEMLENGKYPIHLKNRIRGDEGHLSNKQALDLFINHRSATLSHIILSHLSKENNIPEIAKQLFEQYANQTKIIVADRYCASDVYTITNNATNEIVKIEKPQQMVLF
ncbi:MAG: MBL fold metallo-hydrolase [Chitinophagaceae bacterium]